MADVCDDAAEHIQAEMDSRLARAAILASQREMQPTGFCRNPNCDLPLEDEADGAPSKRLFCGLGCSKAFELLRGSGSRAR